MVTQNMLRRHEGNLFFFPEKSNQSNQMTTTDETAYEYHEHVSWSGNVMLYALNRISVINPRNTMVLILDGNSELGAHVRSHLCYLICCRHLIRSIVTQI